MENTRTLNLLEIYNWACELFIKCFRTKYWQILVAVVATLICLTAFPFPNKFYQFYENIKYNKSINDSWDAILQQKEHPFTNLSYDPNSHEGKKTFRLTVPIIARLFNLNVIGIIALQIILGFAMFWAAAKLVYRFTNDKLSSIFFTLSLACIYLGKGGIGNVSGWCDIYGYAFLVFAIFLRNPLLIFCCVQIAAWSDERALIGSALVFAWHFIQLENFKFTKYQDFLKNTINCWFIVASWLLYFIIRITLSKYFGLNTSSGGIEFLTFQFNSSNLFSDLWSGYEGFWILMFIGLFVSIKLKDSYVISILIFWALYMLSTFFVFDVTKSLSYAAPGLFILAYYLKHILIIEDLQKLLFLCFLVSALSPTYSYIGHWGDLAKPTNFLQLFEPVMIKLKSIL